MFGAYHVFGCMGYPSTKLGLGIGFFSQGSRVPIHQRLRLGHKIARCSAAPQQMAI